MTSKDHQRAPVDEEAKAKFRAALEAKGPHAGTDAPRHGAHGKVEGAHGPETSGRAQMFRRKSG
ncbi:DUF5302 domain-containing protein [Phycicoccus endophyticus]|uniref:DUF5302 domain-containing protein n=1 Tax=Phycicoccus endophyticus TaxID=1690220 RepID=A0A7G9R512_9MICO|nr:DUF5302 domain-containing protein [Phycicoccus endophyticus]NHI20921.1 DUF5302 domain-containing protein [Phycicoccus endophyticus]QNN50687.1 DUF5302 domain-containing protein [Phycicoccus endophyticus]GGL22288.1 hypothetical protein GCM10012283_00450 [Phycicoccus endophyticus]